MQTYVTTEEQLLTDVIAVIDNALGLPTAYTQTWSYARVRNTDQKFYIPKPDVDIPIPYGNVMTETYNLDWLATPTSDTGNV